MQWVHQGPSEGYGKQHSVLSVLCGDHRRAIHSQSDRPETPGDASLVSRDGTSRETVLEHCSQGTNSDAAGTSAPPPDSPALCAPRSASALFGSPEDVGRTRLRRKRLRQKGPSPHLIAAVYTAVAGTRL